MLCFGGDGTFNWVASTVLAMRAEAAAADGGGSGDGDAALRFAPDLVPCPLGTGNDLARSLGWGAKFPGFAALPRFVSDAAAAPRGTQIDLWRLDFQNTARSVTWRRQRVSRPADASFARRAGGAADADAKLLQRWR